MWQLLVFVNHLPTQIQVRTRCIQTRTSEHHAKWPTKKETRFKRYLFEHIFAIDWAPASHYLSGLHANHALIHSGHSSVTLPGSSWPAPSTAQHWAHLFQKDSFLFVLSTLLHSWTQSVSVLADTGCTSSTHRISHQESSSSWKWRCAGVCSHQLTELTITLSWISELTAKPAMTRIGLNIIK